MASVAISEGIRRRVTKRPFTTPITTPANTDKRIAATTGRPVQIINPATRTPDRLATWPTDRSNSPLATAKVSPDDTIIRTEIWTRMLLMLLTDKKRSLANAKATKITRAAATVP